MRPLQTFIRSATPLTLAGSLLPLLNTTSWWARAWDFPRLQLAALAGCIGAVTFLRRRSLSGTDQLLGWAASASLLLQLPHIYRHLPFAPTQVPRALAPQKDSLISLMTANVRMRNRNTAAVMRAIRRHAPDLVLLLEMDAWWQDRLSELDGLYPHSIKQPQSNTYGMHLYSRLPLVNPEIRFLLRKDVPSIRTRIQLRDQREIWFFGMHPHPPVRANMDGEVELEGSKERDVELALAGLEVQQLREPVILAGDLNDVAWSHTTRRFQRISDTLDPRVGRGFYNTYHARYPFFRFPLDHLFHTAHFSVVEFTRGGWIGSDHFPIFAVLALNSKAAAQPLPTHSA